MTQVAPESRRADPGPTLEDIKSRMKAAWEDGDYAGFATYMEAGAVDILDGWQIPPGQRLLDIGCGAGQSAIPAARRGHSVVGIDIAANLIGHARARAHAEGVDAQFDVGDAEALPYADASFDVVITLIGAMFAPRPDLVVNEIARVLRPGGRLYMANWTPRSMPAEMFKCIAAFVPPPDGIPSPILWGDEATAADRLSGHFHALQLDRKRYTQWHYPFDPHAILELFRARFGPVKRAFDALESDPERQSALRTRLHEVYLRNSDVHADGSTTITGGEYLEIMATRAGAGTGRTQEARE